MAPSEIEECGIGGLRRRDPRDVGREMARLHHDKGARVFVLVDDNLLGGDQRVAHHWLAGLQASLSRAGVDRIALSLSMDASEVDDRVLELLLEMGMVRTLAGVEALTAEGAASLGRRADPARSLEVVRRLRARGIVTAFNSLLVHPESTASSISAELEALREFADLHIDTLSVSVHTGTAMWRRMMRAGRLSGGHLSWRYECADPVASRFRALMIRLRLQGMGTYGVSVLAHDLALGLAVSRRLDRPDSDPVLESRLQSIVQRMNDHRLDALEAALDLAASPLDDGSLSRSADGLVDSFTMRMREVERRLVSLEGRMNASTPRTAGSFFYRSAVASSFVLCGVLASGCGGSTDLQGDTESDAPAADIASESGDPVDDPPMDVSGEDVDDEVCTDDDWREESFRLNGLVDHCDCGPGDPYGIVLDGDGTVVDVISWSGTIPAEIRACYLDALATETFPCLAESEVFQVCYVCLV